MLRRKVMFGSMVCFVSIILASLVLAASTEEPRGRGGQGGRRGGDRVNREERRGRMAERMKEQLGANDEEWKAIEPKLQKVMNLSRQIRSSGRGMSFGRGSRRGGERDRGQGRGQGERPDGSRGRERTAVEKAGDDLLKVLDDSSAKPEDIKAKLTVLRKKREEAKKELAKSQKELQKILSVKQEATLVLAGILD